MKKEQIKLIGAGTYDRKELYILTKEEFEELLGKEISDNWLTNRCRTETQASKLSMKELIENMNLDEKVEEILREKLNYKSKQMLIYFGK
jgi:hypothetical protein